MQSICEQSSAEGQARQAVLPRASWIATAAEFSLLKTDWDDLFARAKAENIFVSFGWMSAWWKHFGKGQLAVIAVRDAAGRLIGIAPFYISRSSAGAGTRRLGFLADDLVGSDYLNVLVDPASGAEAVEEVARILFTHRRAWDYIELRDTPDSSIMAALSAELLSRGMRICTTERRICRYIPLPVSFEKYLAGIGRSLRANYRRRWRLLQDEHQAECLAISGAAEIERHFPELLALHRMRFEQRAAESAFLAHGIPEFQAEAMRVMAAQGCARLFLLKAGGEAVAALYGFSVGRTFQFYQCGMHPGWVKYGLGQVLIGNAIEHGIAAGHATFDFLRGDESYKMQWAGQMNENVTLRFFDQRPASVIARWSLRITAAIRGVARQVRSGLRRGAKAAG